MGRERNAKRAQHQQQRGAVAIIVFRVGAADEVPKVAGGVGRVHSSQKCLDCKRIRLPFVGVPARLIALRHLANCGFDYLVFARVSPRFQPLNHFPHLHEKQRAFYIQVWLGLPIRAPPKVQRVISIDALPRADLMRQGARPVTYFPLFRESVGGSVFSSTRLRDFEATYRGFSKHYDERVPERTPMDQMMTPAIANRMGVTPTTEEGLLRKLKPMIERDFLAFLKPFDADLPEDARDNYYMEREWRLVGQFPFRLEQIQGVYVAGSHRAKIEAEFPTLKDRIHEAR